MDQRSRLSGKRILLGVSGSIAAYKSVDIVRRLIDQGAEVRVALTKHAAHFVSPLTLEVLSGRPVLCDEYGVDEHAAIGHIDITDGLDAALVAPATANIIGKIASGIADDSLSTAMMALDCPLLIAPAMNDRMYRNPILNKNIHSLKELGVRFIEPGIGSLACGTIGQGRLADTNLIIGELASLFVQQDLTGKTILVTAGPTREFIDAVRFISNPSTGKMGYAIAAAAHERGAEVTLISGPSQLVPPQGVKIVHVVSAAEMHSAVKDHIRGCQIVVMSAAVSDFRPVRSTNQKIKKDDAASSLELVRTEDILRDIGASTEDRLLVGFAAETNNVEHNAVGKLKEKKLDMIVANDLLMTGSGFGTDTNAVVIIDRNGKKTVLPTMLKSEIASKILDSILELLAQKNS